MSSAEDVSLIESSGNVFADLDVPEPEEALVKAHLAHAISTIVAERDLTQAETAALLGVDQPKVSAVLRGRLTGFSVERLFRFLLALDRDVEIVVQPKTQARSRTSVKVVAGS